MQRSIHRTRQPLVLWAALLAMLAATVAISQPRPVAAQLTLFDLGTLGGASSSANGINAGGAIVGQSATTSGETHAFLWRAGSGMTDLGTLGGPNYSSAAYAINASGAVAGKSYTVPPPPPSLSAARVNASGQIAGKGDSATNPQQLSRDYAVLWQNGAPTDLGTLGGDSSANGINAGGAIVGESETTSGETHAFLWSEGGGGSIAGQVTDPDGRPVPGAFVQACLNAGHPCAVTTTGAQGQYLVTGLADGQYIVKAFPPAESNLAPGTLGPLTIASGASLTGQDIQLAHLSLGLPPGTSIMPSREGGDGIPVVHWEDTLRLVTHGCAGGSASYTVAGNDSDFVRSGSMLEDPAGTYSATILPFFPNHDYATVSITIHCPDDSQQLIAFTIYIDPSGTVRTVDGTPIAGATVTLFRSDSDSGPFEIVPDGSAIMSPANRTNPGTTDAAGHFGWDVIAGFYKVRAEKAGCVSPTDPKQPFVESDVLAIPPPVTDLDLRLNCDATQPTITIITPADGASYILHQTVAAHYSCEDGGSGVASCAGPVANGANIDTSTVGAHTFTVNATDNVGNASSASVTYNVKYGFRSFLPSIRGGVPSTNNR